jgi:uncharacterized membrane protein
MTTTTRRHLPSWRVEELKTTLWLVPAICIAAAMVLFLITYNLDEAAYKGSLQLPWWIRTGSADAGRSVLIGIAAAVITVVGLVFSITIVALTLASQQFGPRMLRSFIRDAGTQFTLGIFVSSFVYSLLALGSITAQPAGDFVPHISITVAELLMCVDIIVLIYFIHHVAKTIQLPEVIARIARDLGRAIDDSFPERIGAAAPNSARIAASELDALNDKLASEGVPVPARRSGYLQIVGYGQLIDIAERADGVIHLSYRVGHFVHAGRPLAVVWPASAAPQVSRALDKAHITGPYRTYAQDPVFPIDQLAEIGIRALSPAVNDTFTALTCIDWLAEGLCNISGRVIAEGVYRDRRGRVRLVEMGQSYDRMVNRAFDKIRQSSRAMPAVLIRLIDSLTYVVEYSTSAVQRDTLLRQGEMILTVARDSVTEENDLADIVSRHDRLVRTAAELEEGERLPRVWNGDR